MGNDSVIIYGLHDPRDGALRYVGKTKNLKLRLTQHLTPKELRLNHRRAKWLRSLRALGLKPEARVIEEATADTWEARERHWIASHRAQGANLVNGTDGGEGGATSKGRPCSEARRRAISAALMGHPATAVNKVVFDDARLAEMYLTEKQSARAIGAAFGVSDKPVLRRLRELGITRDRSETAKLRGYKGARGRNSRPQSHKVECKRGHAYTPENTYIYPDGQRYCRECKRQHARLTSQHQKIGDSRCE